jgi:hypothetical protein
MEKEKIARFSSIFLINLGIKGLIDLIIAPFLVIQFDYPTCFCLLMIIYILVGIISIYIYDSGKKDILFVESLKEAMNKHEKFLEYNRLVRLIVKKSKGKKKRPLLILLLSFKNPGLAVIFMRKGTFLYNGFTSWVVFYFFLVNIFIMNLYFMIVLYTGFSVWKLLGSIF